MPKRRPIEVFSLSFLDCLCCGFGAILLLFLLSIGSGKAGAGASPTVQEIEALRQRLTELESIISQRTAELASAIDPTERAERLEATVALEALVAELEQQKAAIEAEMGREQKVRAESQRLLKSFTYEQLPPIGLPVDATHVVFVVDTSGSMRHPFTKQLHEAVLNQIRSLLEQLPEIRAIQFIDSSGNYMMSGIRRTWIPDTASSRNQAIRTLRTYPLLSVSDPAPGISRAFRDLRKGLTGDDRMAIYMLGDDFRGSTRSFLVKLNALNPRSSVTGQRAVSISAIGFPTLANPFQLGQPQGNVRFANIMREVTAEHGGVLILKPRI